MPCLRSVLKKRLRGATSHPRSSLALSSLQLGALLFAPAHERLVALVVAQNPLALDPRLEAAEEAVERLAGPCHYLDQWNHLPFLGGSRDT